MSKALNCVTENNYIFSIMIDIHNPIIERDRVSFMIGS